MCGTLIQWAILSYKSFAKVETSFELINNVKLIFKTEIVIKVLQLIMLAIIQFSRILLAFDTTITNCALVNFPSASKQRKQEYACSGHNMLVANKTSC
jgi:hypothetical protein